MWNVLFFEAPPSLTPEGQVGIFATNTGWNDFGYNFNACMRIQIAGQVRDYSIKVLPYKEDIAEGTLSHWISYLASVSQGKETFKPRNKIYPNFITVFSSVDIYKELSRTLPDNLYEDLLSSVYEINHCLDTKRITDEVYRSIIESAKFATGVLRNAGPYEAFRFGYFGANRIPPPVDARIPFEFSTKFEDFPNAHSVRFNYKDLEVMSDRVHCLIGVNGIGKTRFLNSLIFGCLAKVNSLSAQKSAPELYSRSGELISLGSFNLPNWQDLPAFSRVNMYSTDPHNYLPRTTNLKGTFDYHYFDMGLEGNISLSRQLGDLLRSEDTIGSENRFVLLKKVMQQAIPNGQLMIPVLPSLENSSKISDSSGKSWIPIGALRGGELRTLEIIGNIDSSRDLAFKLGNAVTTPLSSGQKMYFRFATHFLTSATQGMLVLIDEPETHLHPNLITEFMNLLYLVLEATKSVAIIATHSVYIVRETPSHCAHIFKKDKDEHIRIENVYLNTLGASISTLSNTVFGDSLVQSFTDKVILQISDMNLDFDQVIERYTAILSLEMLAKIREKMKDRRSLQ